jgi:hypothetical protein
MYKDLTIIGLFIFVYSAIAGGVQRTPITGSIVSTGFGIALGPVGLGWLGLDVERTGLRALAELMLALVLFTDAANADLSVLGKSWGIPERLLLIGLPLTILLGYAVGGILFRDLGLLEIAILATMLAPTDAALWQGRVFEQSSQKTNVILNARGSNIKIRRTPIAHRKRGVLPSARPCASASALAGRLLRWQRSSHSNRTAIHFRSPEQGTL